MHLSDYLQSFVIYKLNSSKINRSRIRIYLHNYIVYEALYDTDFLNGKMTLVFDKKENSILNYTYIC